MVYTASGMALVKTYGEMVRVSMGKRESQQGVASGRRRCGYKTHKQKRRLETTT